jgi:hypothetical protein
MSGKRFVQWQWHLDGRRTDGVGFDAFVSKLPGPLAMHIAAFTGLYIIVGCLREPQFAVCEALIGLALVERDSFGNKSTVVSFNLLLGTSGKNFSLV